MPESLHVRYYCLASETNLYCELAIIEKPHYLSRIKCGFAKRNIDVVELAVERVPTTNNFLVEVRCPCGLNCAIKATSFNPEHS